MGTRTAHAADTTWSQIATVVGAGAIERGSITDVAMSRDGETMDVLIIDGDPGVALVSIPQHGTPTLVFDDVGRPGDVIGSSDRFLTDPLGGGPS